MTERGAASHSEIPSAEAENFERVGGDGESQESQSYYDQHGNPVDENGYFVRNNESNRSDDRSSGKSKVIRVWSEKG